MTSAEVATHLQQFERGEEFSSFVVTSINVEPLELRREVRFLVFLNTRLHDRPRQRSTNKLRLALQQSMTSCYGL